MEELGSGGCLCGAVRFRLTGRFERFFLCHCARCRKDSGSAHSANLFSTEAGIEWLSGQEAVRVFRLPGTRHEKGFCATCGSALPVVQGEGAALVVPAGCLDSALDLQPEARICYDSRAEWVDGICASDVIAGLPD